MRIVIADDSVLLREGLARLLIEVGLEPVAAVGDGAVLLLLTAQGDSYRTYAHHVGRFAPGIGRIH